MKNFIKNIVSEVAPPPAYDAGHTDDTRSAHLWDVEWEVFSVWDPLQRLIWSRLDSPKWVLDTRDTSSWRAKLHMTHGGAEIYTVRTSSHAISTPSKKHFGSYKFRSDAKADEQRLEVKLDGGIRFEWRSNEIMSNVNGRCYDTAAYTLVSHSGQTLATLSILAPTGTDDGCLRLTPAFDKSGIDEGLAMTTFSTLFYYQWKEQMEQMRNTSLQGRLATMETVRDSMEHVPGRKRTYGLTSRAEVEAYMHETSVAYAANVRRRNNATSSNNSSSAATAAVISSTTTCC